MFGIAISWAAFVLPFLFCSMSKIDRYLDRVGTRNESAWHSLDLLGHYEKPRNPLFQHILHYQLKLLQTLFPKGSQNKLSPWRIERKIALIEVGKIITFWNDSPGLLTLNLSSLWARPYYIKKTVYLAGAKSSTIRKRPPSLFIIFFPSQTLRVPRVIACIGTPVLARQKNYFKPPWVTRIKEWSATNIALDGFTNSPC